MITSRQHFNTCIIYQIVTTVKMYITVLWVMTMLSFANGYQLNYMVPRPRRPRLLPKLFMNIQLENNFGNIFRGILHGVSDYWGWDQFNVRRLVKYWVMEGFKVRSCKHLTQPQSWRITPFWPSATAYSIHSQLSSISGDRSYIRNPRKRHAVAIGTDLS